MSILNWVFKIFDKDDEQDLTHSVENLRVRATLVLDHDNTQLVDKVDEIDAFLHELGEAVSALRNQAKKTIRGNTYFGGMALANISEAIAHHLENTESLRHQHAQATGLWAKCVLSIAAHYHHLVGPAMIANARANERINQSEFATNTYRAVVADFTSAREPSASGFGTTGFVRISDVWALRFVLAKCLVLVVTMAR